MIRSRSGRCVVFDLDDTLYDEADFVQSGFSSVSRALRERYGIDCRDMLRERLESRAWSDAFQTAAAQFVLPADAVDFMLATYREHAPVLEPRAGIRDLLLAIRERDGVIGCITDGRSVTQRAKLDALGLAEFIDVLLISEETGHTKPDAHNFQEMMRRVDANEFWYIADNPSKDFVAPNTLGWRTAGIRSNRNVHRIDELSIPESHRPHLWVDDGARIAAILSSSAEATDE